MSQKTWLYMILMLLSGCSYGLVPTLVDSSYHHGFNTSEITNVQYGFALVIFTIWMILRIGYQSFPSKKDWPYLIGIGICGALCSYSYYLSLTVLPASLAIVLLFQFSWIVLVFEMIIKKQWPTWEQTAGMLLIIAGTFLSVGFIGVHISPVPFWAIGLGLASAVFYAISLYLPSFLGSRSSPLMRSASTVFIATLVIIPLFPPSHLFSALVWQGLWKWGIALAVIGQVLPVLLMLIAIPHIGGRMAGVLGSIELPTTILTAYLILHEPISILKWVGVTMILIGIFVSEFIVSRQATKEVA